MHHGPWRKCITYAYIDNKLYRPINAGHLKHSQIIDVRPQRAPRGTVHSIGSWIRLNQLPPCAARISFPSLLPFSAAFLSHLFASSKSFGMPLPSLYILYSAMAD